MKLSTLLLSSAALIVAGSAYAADLPAKKGAPAKAATGCPAFGAGYFQIPGGDTCMKFSGYFRYQASGRGDTQARGTSALTQSGVYALYMDVKSNSEAGVVNGHFEIGNEDRAYVQIGGLTAGKFDSYSDLGVGGNKWPAASFNDTGVAYSTSMGSATVTVGAVNPEDNFGATATVTSRPDLFIAASMSAGAATIDTDFVAHEALTADKSANGYAMIGKVSLPMAGAKLSVYGAYASAALQYVAPEWTSGPSKTNFNDVSNTTGATSSGSSIGTALSVPAGDGKVNLFAYSISLTDADTDALKETDVGVNYAYTGIKGVTIRPEYVYSAQKFSGTASTDTNVQYVTLRIQRDF